MKKRLYIVLGTLVTLFAAAVVGTACIWPVINVVSTGETPQYPDVLPQYYTAPGTRVFEEARQSVEALERWKVVESDGSQLLVRAERTTRTFNFVDDVTITVRPVTEFVVQVHVRSASRVGKGDLGQNARNIREFFGELDQRLGSVKIDADRLQGAPETPEAPHVPATPESAKPAPSPAPKAPQAPQAP